MTHPVRIQRRRTKGFDLQTESRSVNGLECVYVGRGTYFGNRFVVGTYANIKSEIGEETVKIDNEIAVLLYKNHLKHAREPFKRCVVEQLRGKNLTCWCTLDQPCHADILLEISND